MNSFLVISPILLVFSRILARSQLSSSSHYSLLSQVVLVVYIAILTLLMVRASPVYEERKSKKRKNRRKRVFIPKSQTLVQWKGDRMLDDTDAEGEPQRPAMVWVFEWDQDIRSRLSFSSNQPPAKCSQSCTSSVFVQWSHHVIWKCNISFLLLVPHPVSRIFGTNPHLIPLPTFLANKYCWHISSLNIAFSIDSAELLASQWTLFVG